MVNSHNPQLSVVVVIVSDTTDARGDVSHLAGNLEALTQQINPPPMEVVVPYHLRVEGIEELKRRFPTVVFIPVNDLKTFTGQGGSREHHDELRARGLAAARGEIIGLLEDHARPDPYWCARMVEAHQQSYAAVGGAIENGIDRLLNWAVYFCDFGKYQNPVAEGESPFVSDANVSYKRSALESIRPVWQESFHETAVNWALISRGEKLALSPRIIVYQHRGQLRLGSALKERFVWGRSYAGTRSKLVRGSKRMFYAALSPLLPAVLLLRMAVNVMKKGRCVGAFLKAFPLTTMLTASWSLGELIGYLTARANRSGALVGEPIACARAGDH
ncbi:MAG: glycosyltransferase [Acidobacteria bacterium]|nr:glycosyltransferase [Acidobacteriota bacterium]